MSISACQCCCLRRRRSPWLGPGPGLANTEDKPKACSRLAAAAAPPGCLVQVDALGIINICVPTPPPMPLLQAAAVARGRPPLDPGTNGVIKSRQLASGHWEARTYYRDFNGETLRPAASGPTSSAAERALKKRLTKLTAASAKNAPLARDDRFNKTLDMWIEDQEHRVRHGTLGDGSLRTYLVFLEAHIRPRLGKLRNHEVKVRTCDKLVKDKRDELGYTSAKTIRTVLSAACGLAVRYEAMDQNPVKSIERLAMGAGDQKKVKSMTMPQVHAMWDALATYAVRRQRDSKRRRIGHRSLVWPDLPDLSKGMLSTSVRIGEVLAITGEEVIRDTDGNTVIVVDWHIVRERGKGLVRKPGRKGNQPGIELQVPEWSVPMWRARKLAAGTGPLWAARDGGWLDPSNTIGRLRDALDESGFAWVTSHVWRKTVSRFMDEAGVSIGEIADQLGNTRAVAERHYVGKRKRNTKGAAALEALKQEDTGS